ncbi:MAG: enoyl-CoA hydratase/isomerase family protein [Hyphomicrobiales bacterium]|nr:enoyl-CoA hydratase/isomerase family protein [Hyphomicrobiales bacterium]
MTSGAPGASADEAGARYERRGAAGFVVLDRPRALNALTLSMVRVIAEALDVFEGDGNVERVVVVASGGRALCAGGDIRRLYEQGKAGDHAGQLAFWREEYQLNRRIKRYSKPYVSLIDGIVMGGGVGLCVHGSHRVASENCVFAMPEVAIGFFPDVGAAYVLPRLPRRIGAYLAATGLRAGAGDVVALGLAQSFVPSAAFAALADALEGRGSVDDIVARFVAAPPPAPIMAEAANIERWFAELDRGAILRGLQAAAEVSPVAQEALAAMRANSPTSQAIALRQMALGSELSFEDVMRLDFRIVSRICRGHDFYEGVRARIVDKDQSPLWRPSGDEPVEAAAIDAYFAPLGADDLTFPAVAQ